MIDRLERPGLPPLATMYLTTGHRIPAELLAAIEPSVAEEHPLDHWECPLDASREYGHGRGRHLRLVPPGY